MKKEAKGVLTEKTPPLSTDCWGNSEGDSPLLNPNHPSRKAKCGRKWREMEDAAEVGKGKNIITNKIIERWMLEKDPIINGQKIKKINKMADIFKNKTKISCQNI